MDTPARLAVTAAALLTLASCGGDAMTSADCPSPSTAAPGTPPAATEGAVTLRADAAVVTRGRPVTLTATVSGPLRYTAPCGAPAQLVVLDAGAVHVFADSPPERGVRCGDVRLGAAQTADYQLSWTPDLTTPVGSYTAVVMVGDQSEVAVPVIVARAPGQCH